MQQKPGFFGRIVAAALRFRGVVLALAVALLGYGLYSISKASYDVFPEFAPPEVTIRAEAPGLSPEQVEVLVTYPIETAITGVQGISALTSSSIQGLSAITVKFHSGSDIYLVRQLVAERLASVSGQLPQGVVPFMTPLTSSTGVALQMGLASDKQSLMQVRTIADWTVKPRLLAAGGVAAVSVFGGELEQIQIQVQPERLLRYNLALSDVLKAARAATGVRGAGFIDTANQRLVLQSEGQYLSPEQIGRTVLLHQDTGNVTLADVATVAIAPAPPVGAASINGRPAVVVLINSQYGANTLQVTRNLDDALDELRPTLEKQGIILYPDLFRPADFIHTAVHNILFDLLLGGILVIVILFLFLFNLRTAVISFTAIPLSLIAAVLVLDRFGFSLNTMVLGGLAIAIGEVVDDAVIDVENIYRRLRENRHLPNPRPALRVIWDASLEVRKAVVFATWCVVLVFIPILTMSGLAGRLFAPLGLAYITAVVASLAVALTVTPAFSSLLLARRELPEREPPVVRWTKRGYHAALTRVEAHLLWVAGGVLVLLGAGVAALFFVRSEFLPQLREGDFIVHMVAAPGTSLEESSRIGARVADELLKMPSVRIVSQKAGRASEGSSIRGTHMSEIDARLKLINGQTATFSPAEVRRVLDQFPGLDFSIKTFLSERIEETISGYTASVVINIFGNDLAVLDETGHQIAAVLKTIRGAVGVRVQAVSGMPQVTVRLRKAALSQWGFDAVDLLDAVRTAFQGSTVANVYEGNRVIAVSVILAPSQRSDPAAIGGLLLRSPGGAYAPLRELADIYESSGRYEVLHEGTRRVQTVTCDVSGRTVDSFVAQARKAIDTQVSLPAGTYIQFAGTAQAAARARRDLLVYSSLAGVGIVLVLVIAMGHYRNVILLLLDLPFALVGGVLAVLLSGGVLSLGSLVGFVTVFGITLRNSIMMLAHYEHLVAVEGMTWGPEAAWRGASERLAPVLMTALVTAFGLLPLALASRSAGGEIEGPMAIVILGGLATSTIINLLVLPALALRYGRFEGARNADAAGLPA